MYGTESNPYLVIVIHLIGLYISAVHFGYFTAIANDCMHIIYHTVYDNNKIEKIIEVNTNTHLYDCILK